MIDIIFDIETDGLLDKVSKIHCLSYYNTSTKEAKTLFSAEDIVQFLTQENVRLVGHNIIRYDIPVLEKLLGLDLSEVPVIDTLALSWYLYNYMKKHGLEEWGKAVGILKVEIDDWENLSREEYQKRCEVDVNINTTIYRKFMHYLYEIYDMDKDKVGNIITYLNYKLICLRDQERVGIYLNKTLALETKEKLEPLIEGKIEKLSLEMPPGKIVKTKPKVFCKANGELSAHGVKWLKYLEENNLSLDIEEVREPGSPTSHTQLKSWLFELGWEPTTFKTSKATGEEVPQVSLPNGEGLCYSVKDMFEEYPVLKELDNLFMLRHRLSIIDAMLETVDDKGYIHATANGLSNTLRFKHSKPVVNLPGVGKPWGEEIRGCLSVKDLDNELFIGFDICSLEDTTKQHYMYFFDPEYVEKMRVPGFDPHIDIAIFANLLTVEEGERFKVLDNKLDNEIPLTEEEEKEYKPLKKARGNAKTVNFGGVYGIGPLKLSKTLKCSLSEATKIHTAYWIRNKAVKEVANSCIVKEVLGQKWLYNPISGFWLYLKIDKDRFSTLNQNSGVYCFDFIKMNAKKQLKNIADTVLEMHDSPNFCRG